MQNEHWGGAQWLSPPLHLSHQASLHPFPYQGCMRPRSTWWVWAYLFPFLPAPSPPLTTHPTLPARIPLLSPPQSLQVATLTLVAAGLRDQDQATAARTLGMALVLAGMLGLGTAALLSVGARGGVWGGSACTAWCWWGCAGGSAGVRAAALLSVRPRGELHACSQHLHARHCVAGPCLGNKTTLPPPCHRHLEWICPFPPAAGICRAHGVCHGRQGPSAAALGHRLPAHQGSGTASRPGHHGRASGWVGVGGDGKAPARGWLC